ncbi:hypothetical protein Dimus_032320 [Dionaea muscipula]
MATGIIHDQNLPEKNMGCMAGFFNLRRHILPGGKRFYPKRLPPSSSVTGVDSSSEAASSVGSPAFSAELMKAQEQLIKPAQSLELSKPSPPAAETRSQSPDSLMALKSSLAVSGFEFKEGVRSPWKFAREAPRLSLDSRFVVDAKGSLHPREIRTSAPALSGDESDKQRRSPSVVARLMGLEPLPGGSGAVTESKVELRRSASESRSRDLIQYPFIDSNILSNSAIREFNNFDQITQKLNANTAKFLNQAEYTHNVGAAKPERLRERRPLQHHQQRKSYYDTADFFPEPKRTVSISGEIERRLKMKGIDEPSKDLETLKQILEAVQLKGLLHSKPMVEHNGRQNFVYDGQFTGSESPIVVKKPGRSSAARRSADESHPPSFGSKVVNRRNMDLAGETIPSGSPRQERPKVNRDEDRSPSLAATRKKQPALSVETRRRERESDVTEQRRVSPVQSPRLGSRKSCQTTSSLSPRGRRPTTEIKRIEKPTVRAEDESSTISESSYSTCSHTDTERLKMEECREGRSLLERCDKLLHSIAEMTATTTTTTATTTAAATELQPSPVSVLDSSFHKEDDESPSPVNMKRTIDFKAVDQLVELEDEMWSPWPSSLSVRDSSDLTYISEILRASDYLLQDETNAFLLLEKQRLLKGRDTSKPSRIQRRLIFDTINEILDRNQQLPPWKVTTPPANSVSGKPSLSHIWSELQRIQEPAPSDDLITTISGVLKRDLAKDSMTGWGDFPMEMSEMVLDIERLIFKDLIGDTIRDLAIFTGKNVAPRRKLVF